MNYFAKNISYLRRKHRYKQAHMEAGVGVSRATWSNYENGLTEPSLDKLIEIAEFFKISLDELARVNLMKQPEAEETDDPLTTTPKPYTANGSSIEGISVEDNKETGLWYLLSEIKALREEINQIKNNQNK